MKNLTSGIPNTTVNLIGQNALKKAMKVAYNGIAFV